MGEQEILQKARRLRVQEHRLRPVLRLRTLEEVQEFAHSKSLVSVLGGNELPSVISAILGREWKPSRRGFTSWEDWWSLKISGQNLGHALGKLDRAPDILSTRIFRNTKTLLSQRLWPVLDPIVKHHADLVSKHGILSTLEWNILEHVDAKGPIRTDHLRSQLSLGGKSHTARFHRALAKLEDYALIVGYEDPHPERHLHANIWQAWRRRTAAKVGKARPSYREAVEELLATAIDAAVIAPGKEVGKWFQWKEDTIAAKERLLSSGRIIQAGSFIISRKAAGP